MTPCRLRDVGHGEQRVVGQHVGHDVEQQVVARVGPLVGERGQPRLGDLGPVGAALGEPRVGQRRDQPGGQHLRGRHRAVGPRGGRQPGERRQPAGPEAQPDDPPPAAHLHVEPAGAHTGDGDGLARRHPGSWVAAELDGEGARGVRQHLAVVPAAVGQVPPQRPAVLDPVPGRRPRRLAHEVDVARELARSQHPRGRCRGGGRRGDRRPRRMPWGRPAPVLSPLSYRAPTQPRQGG